MGIAVFHGIIGAVIASAFWWIKIRSLNGVISDLKDVKNDVQTAKDKIVPPKA